DGSCAPDPRACWHHGIGLRAANELTVAIARHRELLRPGRVRGNAAATRTPTGCFANTSPSHRTSRSAHNANSTRSHARSTHDLDRPSDGCHHHKRSPTPLR